MYEYDSVGYSDNRCQWQPQPPSSDTCWTDGWNNIQHRCKRRSQQNLRGHPLSSDRMMKLARAATSQHSKSRLINHWLISVISDLSILFPATRQAIYRI